MSNSLSGWEKFKHMALVHWPFWGVHIAAVVGIAMLGFSWSGLALALGLYYVRLFFVTAGYHRYFAHRTYKTSRWFQFLLGVGATTAVQKGPLWWAAHHRNHHRYSDEVDDIHSPKQRGFWWSHVGWILSPDYKHTCWDDIKDMSKYPELRWLNKHDLVAPISMAVLLFLIGGAHALVWGFFVSTVLVWHGTFTINSLCHVWGGRRYETTDTSRNNLVLALITMGEGWHNNHHYYMNSVNQGFRWYEIDMTYYVLRALEKVGVVWKLHTPPAHIIQGTKRREEYVSPTEVVIDEPTLERAA